MMRVIFITFVFIAMASLFLNVSDHVCDSFPLFDREISFIFGSLCITFNSIIGDLFKR